MNNWSEWHVFPKECRFPDTPKSPGVYELRHKSTEKLIRVGESINVRDRMKSLLPPPYGTGTRNNIGLRNYLLEHIADVEYRILECDTKQEAKAIQDKMLSTGKYIFNT